VNPRWYVDGILPNYGSVNLLGGNTHAGKSTLLYAMVQSLRYGQPFLGKEVRQPKFVAVVLADRSAEDNPMWQKALDDELIDDFIAATSNPDYIETVKITMKSRAGGMQGHEKFEKLVNKLACQEDMVLIVDVFTTGFLGNIMSIEQVKDNMDCINFFCTKHKITLIGTGYGVKPKNDQKQRYERYVDRLIGASPLRGGASSVMYLATKEESAGDGYEQQVFEVLSRHAPGIRLGVELDDNRIFHAVPLSKKLVVEEAQLPACYDILTSIPIIATSSKDIYETYKDLNPTEHCSKSRFRAHLSALLQRDEIEQPERGKYRTKVSN